jgi:hypothetical protein
MQENNNDSNNNNNIQEDEILKSETNNSNSQDSFNKDLQKKFEEYKKGEPRIPHRPISSYTSKRNFNQVNKDIDQINQIPNKPQSAQAKSNNNSKNSNHKEHPSKNNTNIANNINENEGNNPDLTAEQILQDLNNFLISHKIKKSDFLDNCGVFLTFEDFVDVFKQIHYTVNKKYLKILFNYNNDEGAKDDYIHMKKFVELLTFYKIDGIVSDSEFSKVDSNTVSNQSNSKFSQQNILSKTLSEMAEAKSNKSIYEIKYINEQYSQFNKDIIEILKNSKKRDSINNNNNYLNSKRSIRGKNITNSRITIESRSKKSDEEKQMKEIPSTNFLKNNIILGKNKNIDNINQEPEINNIEDNPEVNIEEKILEQNRKRLDYSQILKNKEKEEQKDAVNMRLQFEKRDKNFLKDCAYKCEECNRICNILGLNRVYSITFDEEMKCLIQEEGKEDEFITLKELIIDWRRLYKQYHQRENLERYKEVEDASKTKNVELILNERKKEKEEKHRQIKEVLIEAVRLKTKLKNQLDDLKSNIKIDEKVVLEHLKRAGMDIPDIEENKNKIKSNKIKNNKNIKGK